MHIDRAVLAATRARSAHDHGVSILLDAWTASPPDRRAAMIVAQGDLPRAASAAGRGWAMLLEGDVNGALNLARESNLAPGMAMLEAEALFTAGAIVAGLTRLVDMHRRGDPAGTVALVRRRHQLGDHLGAVAAAQTLPWNAHAALTGARAALIAERPGNAINLLEPFLEGFAPIPEPAVAGAFAMTVAAVLAKFGNHADLQHFADRLLASGDLAEDMMPTAARTAWIAGRGREAWERFNVADNPWCVAARLELAVLSGDAELAGDLLRRAGPLGVPSAPAVALMNGPPDAPAGSMLTDSAREVFAEGQSVHVWRTHPFRWQPWIDAALRTPARIVVCDLAAQDLPDAESVPASVLDDGALVEALAPIPVPAQPVAGAGVAISAVLCRGEGVGHDWPQQEDRLLRHAFEPPTGEPAVRVVSSDEALAHAAAGSPTVVLAPPGDPFWAGPLPARAWPHMRVVRANAETGWQGAGSRVVETVRALLNQIEPRPPPLAGAAATAESGPSDPKSQEVADSSPHAYASADADDSAQASQSANNEPELGEVPGDAAPDTD